MTIKDYHCAECGLKFSRASYLVDYSNVFCSRVCYDVWNKRGKKELRICEYCSTAFLKDPASLRRSRHDFCSRVCSFSWAKKRAATLRLGLCRCGCGTPLKPWKKTSPARRPIYVVGHQMPQMWLNHRRSAKTMQTQCTTCGRQFIEPAYEKHRPSKHRFCSRRCFGLWKRGSRKSVLRTCEACDKKFLRLPCSSKGSKHHYCSQKCMGLGYAKRYAHPKVPVPCVNCGKIVECQPHRLRYNQRVFCSARCVYSFRVGVNNPSWKGGVGYYRGPNWVRQSDLARARDNYTCQRCAKRQTRPKLDVHHVIPFRYFGIRRYREANELSNLRTLCRLPCHRLADSNASRAYRLRNENQKEAIECLSKLPRQDWIPL